MTSHFYQHGPTGRARILDETIEAHQARIVGCEQILNALTLPHQRNPVNAALAIRRDGYAVYDGPASIQPSTGSTGSHR